MILFKEQIINQIRFFKCLRIRFQTIQNSLVIRKMPLLNDTNVAFAGQKRSVCNFQARCLQVTIVKEIKQRPRTPRPVWSQESLPVVQRTGRGMVRKKSPHRLQESGGDFCPIPHTVPGTL